jgi:hypothetical protein
MVNTTELEGFVPIVISSGSVAAPPIGVGGGVGIAGRGGAASREQARLDKTNKERMGVSLLKRFIEGLGLASAV